MNNLAKNTWFSHYPHCQYIIYDDGSEFKPHFEVLSESYGIKPKPTTVKNTQAHEMLQQVHQVIIEILCTTEFDMANTVDAIDIDAFVTDADVPFS